MAQINRILTIKEIRKSQHYLMNLNSLMVLKKLFIIFFSKPKGHIN